ncbi:hypothetical protein [Arthrobacter sp. UYEF36]|uniref:hypothetical protein n=1 Tax=Arthrobacter sp. UYEF36 TaxID=1756366 RepID=UPI00339354C7
MSWQSSGLPPREDREFSEVVVSLPTMIAGCWFDPGRETIVALEASYGARSMVAAADAVQGMIDDKQQACHLVTFPGGVSAADLPPIQRARPSARGSGVLV